jgi:hypothetical protein
MNKLKNTICGHWKGKLVIVENGSWAIKTTNIFSILATQNTKNPTGFAKRAIGEIAKSKILLKINRVAPGVIIRFESQK